MGAAAIGFGEKIKRRTILLLPLSNWMSYAVNIDHTGGHNPLRVVDGHLPAYLKYFSIAREECQTSEDELSVKDISEGEIAIKQLFCSPEEKWPTQGGSGRDYSTIFGSKEEGRKSTSHLLRRLLRPYSRQYEPPHEPSFVDVWLLYLCVALCGRGTDTT